MNTTTNRVIEALYCDGKAQLTALVNTLPESEKRSLVEPLMSVLQSGRDDDRINAIYVLGLLGPIASSAVPAMIQAPQTSRLANVGWEVTTALPKIGAQYAVPALIEALGPPPQEGAQGWATRQHDARIMEHLAAFGPEAASAAPHLAAFLGSYTAEDALGKMGPAAVAAVLKRVQVQQGSKTHPYIYINAADVLASVGSASSQPLREAFDAATTENQRLAILNIFQHGPTSSRRMSLPLELYVVLVEKCFAQEGRELCQKTHEIVASRSDLIPALKAGMASTNVYIRANSAAAVLRQKPDDADALENILSLLKNDDDKVKLVALDAVADAKSTCDKLVPGLTKLWRDSSSLIRNGATKC